MPDNTPYPHSPPHQPPADLTQLIEKAGTGSDQARTDLLEAVAGELRTIAVSLLRHERNDHTLNATALVNESYLRLFRTGGLTPELSFEHRHAFFLAASTAMRRILIDHALSTLEAENERAASVVRLRFYAGRQIEEIAELLGVASRSPPSARHAGSRSANASNCSSTSASHSPGWKIPPPRTTSGTRFRSPKTHSARGTRKR